MEREGMVWAGVMLTLVASAFVVPYTLLSGVDAWYGSFLFWTIFALISIGVNALIVRRWRD
jgi:hypothetical protein